MRYECWGDDHEDLTQKVEEELGRGKIPTFSLFGLGRSSEEPSPRKVLVVCSNGHENVFTIED